MKTITKSSGNVFADLGLPNPEELTYKAELVSALRDIIQKRGLTQVRAATLCGTDQGTLSKVLRGRLDLVTTDRLIRWIQELGARVRILVEDTPDHVSGPVSVCFSPA